LATETLKVAHPKVRTFKRPNLKNKIQNKMRQRQSSWTQEGEEFLTQPWQRRQLHGNGWRWYGDGAGVSNGDG